MVLVAIVVRGRAVATLPVDYDEDNYLRAGQQYRAALTGEGWTQVLARTELSEHPVVGKLIYGAVLLTVPPAPEIPERRLSAPPDNNLPHPQLDVARVATATAGVLSVALLALMNPIAGLFLAVSSWSVKYTSEVMLEGFGVFFSLVTALAYVRGKVTGSRRWLVLSAVALGVTAATKYVYAVVGVAIAADWLLEWLARKRRRSRSQESGTSAASRLLLAWGALAVAVFVAADFYLWPDPVGRLLSSLVFHESYAFGPSVAAAGHPPWQPIVWLTQPVPWHQDVFLVRADVVIAGLGALGVPLAWRQDRLFALWLIVGLAFLLVWPTKWPQYTNVLVTPLAVSAAGGVRTLWLLARRLVASQRRERLETQAPAA